ncbi:MAG: ctaF, partial [Pseudonocardiales bacterium]|nr:ctaF [Pseudonocardiales bacterium]
YFIARRIDPRPEDRSDADISDGAGDLGFFSPGSYWPLGIAMSASVTAYALAFRQWWLVVVGVGLIVTTVSGLLFEYYVGQRKALR